MICRDYFSVVLLTGIVLVSSLALPVYGKFPNEDKEMKVRHQLRMQAVSNFHADREVITWQMEDECKQLVNRIKFHRDVISNIYIEEQKKLQGLSDREKLDLLKKELVDSEKKLTSVLEEKTKILSEQTAPVYKAMQENKILIEGRLHKLCRRVEAVHDLLKFRFDDLYSYIKVLTLNDSLAIDLLNSSAKNLDDKVEFLDRAAALEKAIQKAIPVEESQVRAVWQEKKGSYEEQISCIGATLDEAYKSALDKCRDEKNSIVQKIHAQELELKKNEENITQEYDAIIAEQEKFISSIRERIKEIRRPYLQKINDGVEREEMRLIASGFVVNTD